MSTTQTILENTEQNNPKESNSFDLDVAIQVVVSYAWALDNKPKS